MVDNMNIDQHAGFGAQGNTFIGQQYNCVGLTPADATQIAFSMFREYYPQLRQEALDALYKMVEEKLNKIPQENIVPPKPKVVVPTLQNASLTEEDEIRELYANLLANSMDKVVKDGIRPGFVEIINQLCPDEAKILYYFRMHNTVPTVTLKFSNKDNSGISVVKNFSNIGELTNCEKPFEIGLYFDNLIRLGLLRASPALSALADKKNYEPLKAHPYLKPHIDSVKNHKVNYIKTDFEEGYMELTDYGKSFCKVCLTPPKIVIEIVQQKD